MKINGRNRTIANDDQSMKLRNNVTVARDAKGNYQIDLHGKRGNDVRLKQNDDGSWTLKLDGKNTLRLSADEVANLTIRSHGGNDKFHVAGKLKAPLRIDGGSGNDSVELAPGTDRSKVEFEPGRGVKDTLTWYGDAVVSDKLDTVTRKRFTEVWQY